MVTTRCRDFECDTGGRLTANVSEIRGERDGGIVGGGGLRVRPWFAIDERPDNVGERSHGPDSIAGDMRRSLGIDHRHEYEFTGDGVRKRKRPGHWADPAVEAEFAERSDRGEFSGKLTRCLQHAKRNGQIEPGTGLGQATGREIDGDAPERPRRPRRHDCCPDAITRLTT
jgi:hypothetical protein